MLTSPYCFINTHRVFVAVVIVACLSACGTKAETSQVTLGQARFTVIAPECIRIEYSEKGVFEDAPSLFAINRNARDAIAHIENSQNRVIITTQKIKLTYVADGQAFHRDNLRAEIADGDRVIDWTPQSSNKENLGGTVSTLDGATGPIPLASGILARDGWYLLNDSRKPVLTPDWVKSRDNANNVDWYLFGYGKDYKAALRAFTSLSGKVPMPRKYVLGSWYSRYWPYSTEEYKNIVREYKLHDFPLDVIVMDMDWHKEGWTGWSWDRSLIDDPKALLEWFHDEKLAVTLNDHPADGVKPHEDQYVSFMTALNLNPDTKETLQYDAGNQRYLETLFKIVHSILEQDGVDFWWLDWQQEQYTRSIPDLGNIAWLNKNYYEHSTAGGVRGQSFSRWGGWGDHRYPIHFSGDAHTGFPMLEFEVPMTATAGNQGCFFWSHDIGGHVGPRDEEAFTRWVQFGAMSAALRVHSTRNKDLDRRPWAYGPAAEESMRRAFHLRSQLFPYIYSQVWRSHTDSIPLVRPLYLHDANADESYLNPQEYFFGDDLLVAPITSPGVGRSKIATQTVWFPEGVWFNWFTGEKFVGPKKRLVSADLNEFPLYVRAGALIAMQPYQPRMTSSQSAKIVLRVYPGPDNSESSTFLYDDDGLSLGYQNGEFAFTPLRYSRRGSLTQVTIGQTQGQFVGQADLRSYELQLPNSMSPSEVLVNGIHSEFSYNREKETLSINVADWPIARELSFEIVHLEADNRGFESRAGQRRVEEMLGYEDANQDLGVLAVLSGLKGIGIKVRPDGLYMQNRDNKVADIFLGDQSSIDSAIVQFIDRTCDQERILSQNECSRQNGSVCRFSTAALPPPVLGQVPGCTLYRKVRMNVGSLSSPQWIEELVEAYTSYITRWSIVGPFAYDGKEDIAAYAYEPEKGAIDLARDYVGADSKLVKWQSVQADKEGVINLINYYPFENRIAYAASSFVSNQDQTIVLKANSDDQIELFLNGKKVHSNNIHRGLWSSTDEITLDVPKGRHTLVAKIGNYLGGWAFRIAIETQYPLQASPPLLMMRPIPGKWLGKPADHL